MKRVQARRFGRIAGLATALALTALTPGLAQAADPGVEPGDPALQATTPMEAQPPEGARAQIIGGEQTTVDQYPYVIATLREGGPRPQGQSCTAAVVAPNVLVSAAHCVDAAGTKSVLYGSDDLTQTGGTKIGVKEWIQHPSYQDWSQGYDVSIIVTEQNVPVPDGLQFPRVAGSGDAALTEPGKKSLLLGYGRIAVGENEHGHLKKADNYPIVDGQNTCGSISSFNPAYMVCAGYQDGHDGICQGDSGGPMVVDGVIVGVASWVRTDCGTYGAWGRLTNEMGDWANEMIKKYGEPSEPGKPTASFTADCSNTEPSCTFDASASKDEDGSIASYAWEFGDGKTGTGATPSHTYSQAGQYTVKLTVTDDEGKTGTTTKKVTAGPGPVGEPPQASFTAQCQWDTCTFDGTRSTDPDGDIASYAWDFGDGKTGSGATATHTYPNRQVNYTAELTVTDEGGQSSTSSKQIQCWSFGNRAFCFGQ